MQVEEGIQIGQLRSMVRRRWGMVAVGAGGTLLASVLLASVLPNEYEAWTTILVEPQQISEELVEAGLAQSDLANRLHLMTMQILSRSRLSKIIDDLDLYPDESREMTREEVIQLMRAKIRVEPILPELLSDDVGSRAAIEINTFRLFFRDRSPQKVAGVANRLANDFIDEHIKGRVRTSGETTEFIEAELARLAARIQEVEARIAQVKNENPGTLPEEFAYNQQMLQRTLDALRQTQRELDLARGDETFYRQQGQAAGAMGVASPDSPQRRREILEVALGEYRARGFTDKHPDVLAAEQELALLRARLESQDEGEEQERPLSLSEQTAEAERRRAELRMAAAEAEIQRLGTVVEGVEARIVATPRVAERLDALRREYEHLFASYQDYSNRRQAAQVAANMERRQKGEQIRVLESAFVPPSPTSPNRPLIVALGLMLGLAFGAGLAVLAEAADSSFHESSQLQVALRIPVLAGIPSILFDADRAARRRRMIATGLAAGAVTLLVLGGSAGGYWYVNVAGGRGEPETQQERAPAPGREQGGPTPEAPAG